MDKIPEGYKQLFEIAKVDIVKARRIGMLIPRNILSAEALLEIHEERNKNSMLLSRELAHLVPIEKLDYKILFEYLEAAEITVVNLATELIRKINIENFDYIELLNFQSFSCPEIRNLAKEIALVIPAERIDYAVLRKSLLSDNKYIKALASLLLMNNFDDSVSYVDLINFQEIPFADVREKSRMLALLIPASRLNHYVLIELQKSSCNLVRALAFDLADKIPIKMIKFDELMLLMRTYDNNVAKLVYHLAMKKSPAEINYVICLRLQNSEYSNVRTLARAASLKVSNIYFNHLVLQEFIRQGTKVEQSLATLLLLMKRPEKVRLEALSEYEIYEDADISRRAKELKLEYWSNINADHKAEESFVKQYFN